MFIRVVVAAAGRRPLGVRAICICGVARACEEGPATCGWDVANVKAPHGSPHIRAAAAARGCTAGRAKVRGEGGKHHVTRIDGWGVPLEFLADELEECRRGYEHTRGQVEDVKR